MTSNILQQLQNLIDYDVVKKFNIDDLVKYKFVPLCIKNSDVLIAATSDSNHADLKPIVSSVLNINSARFSPPINSEDFNQLIQVIKSKLGVDSGEDFDNFDDIGNIDDIEDFSDIDNLSDIDDDVVESSKQSDIIRPISAQIDNQSAPDSQETTKYSDKAARFAASLNNTISKSKSDSDTASDSFEIKEEQEIKPAESPSVDLSLSSDKPSGSDKPITLDEPVSDTIQVANDVKPQPVDMSSIDVKELSKKKIGEILVELGYVNQDNLFTALIEAKKTHIPLGTILVQRKFVTLDNLKKALSLQQGYEFVDEEKLKINANVINMLPEDFIKLNKVIPISFEDNTLTIGMINPNDKKVINDVVYLTGIRPRIMLITHYEFNKCIETYFSDSKKETDQIIKKMEDETLQMQGTEETLFEQAERELKDDSSTTVKFVNKIVSDAIDMRASDIHIEPRLDCYVVRYRIDGILQEVLRLPAKTESAILTRLKVISKMNIAEHRRPQDGSFTIKYKNKDYDFRINTLPVSDKEKMVIRVLAPAVSIAAKKFISSVQLRKILNSFKEYIVYQTELFLQQVLPVPVKQQLFILC